MGINNNVCEKKNFVPGNSWTYDEEGGGELYVMWKSDWFRNVDDVGPTIIIDNSDNIYHHKVKFIRYKY